MEVVAAIIEKDGKILICRRAENKTRALKWEISGRKNRTRGNSGTSRAA